MLSMVDTFFLSFQKRDNVWTNANLIVLRCYCQLYCNFWASLVGLPALLAFVFLIIHISTRTCHVLLIARLTRCSEKMWSVLCIQVRFIPISWLLCTVLMICNLTMFYVKLILFFVLTRAQLCVSLVVTFLPEILNEIGLFCCNDLWDRDGFCGAHYISALVYDHIARLHQVLRVLLRKLPNLLYFIEICVHLLTTSVAVFHKIRVLGAYAGMLDPFRAYKFIGCI